MDYCTAFSIFILWCRGKFHDLVYDWKLLHSTCYCCYYYANIHTHTHVAIAAARTFDKQRCCDCVCLCDSDFSISKFFLQFVHTEMVWQIQFHTSLLTVALNFNPHTGENVFVAVVKFHWQMRRHICFDSKFHNRPQQKNGHRKRTTQSDPKSNEN